MADIKKCIISLFLFIILKFAPVYSNIPGYYIENSHLKYEEISLKENNIVFSFKQQSDYFKEMFDAILEVRESFELEFLKREVQIPITHDSCLIYIRPPIQQIYVKTTANIKLLAEVQKFSENLPTVADTTVECSTTIKFGSNSHNKAKDYIFYLLDTTLNWFKATDNTECVEAENSNDLTINLNSLANVIRHVEESMKIISDFSKLYLDLTLSTNLSSSYLKAKYQNLELDNCFQKSSKLKMKKCHKTNENIQCAFMVSIYSNPIRLDVYKSFVINQTQLANTYTLGPSAQVFSVSAFDTNLVIAKPKSRCLESLLGKNKEGILEFCHFNKNVNDIYGEVQNGLIFFSLNSDIIQKLSTLGAKVNIKDTPLLVENTFEININQIKYSFNNGRKFKTRILFNHLPKGVYANITLFQKILNKIKLNDHFYTFLFLGTFSFALAINFVPWLIYLVFKKICCKCRKNNVQNVTCEHDRELQQLYRPFFQPQMNRVQLLEILNE